MSGSGHGGGEPPDGSYGSLGPVEAAGATESSEPLPSMPAARPVRRRLYLPAALLLAAAGLILTHHSGNRPAQAANSPPPYPSQASRFHYGGPLREAVPGGHEFTLRVLATATSPFDIVEVHQGYRGITTSVTGPLPRTVTPGQSVELDVVYRVTDCGAAPPDAGLPFLDVTLRNARAIQTVSQILGDAYARELSRNLHLACPASDIRTSASASPTPDTGVR